MPEEPRAEDLDRNRDRPLLVLAAWDPELVRFRELAKQSLLSSSRPVVAQAAGIGPVDASAGTTRAILAYAPAHVVLLGTCGAAPRSGIAMGEVVVGTAARLVDPASIEGRAAMPYAAEATLLAQAILGADVAARAVTIANTLGITTDDGLAERLAPLGDVEHLEAYGVARACALAGVPCTAILGVANAVGARGREEWRSNHLAASARAADVAWTAIERSVRTSTTPRSPV